MPWIRTKNADGTDCCMNTDRYDQAQPCRTEPRLLVLARRKNDTEEDEKYIEETLKSFHAKTTQRTER